MSGIKKKQQIYQTELNNLRSSLKSLESKATTLDKSSNAKFKAMMLVDRRLKNFKDKLK